MRPLTFEFGPSGGILQVPVFAALELSMSYEQFGGFTMLRASTGRAIRQQTWRKFKIQITGTGQIPLGLELLDYSLEMTLRCTSPLAIQSSSASIQGPSYRRTDVPVEAYAITALDEELVETDYSQPAGYAVANVGGAITGGSATGLANDATVYTATITVDGDPIAITVTGSAAQTYTALLAAINADLGAAATAAIVSGNVRVTSATTGEDSTVLMVDAGTDELFNEGLTDFVSFSAPVDGTDTFNLTPVTGALAYRLNFWPEFTVYADPPTLDNNRRDATIGWSLNCEEI